MATPFQVRPVTEGELPAFEYIDPGPALSSMTS